MPEGPYFDELAVGQEFGGAPGLTLTSGLAAAHQAVTGDRLPLATDHELCREVTGGAPLASPNLVWDVAIGQSTVVIRRTASPVGARPSRGWFCLSATTWVVLRSVSPSRGARRKASPR